MVSATCPRCGNDLSGGEEGGGLDLTKSSCSFCGHSVLEAEPEPVPAEVAAARGETAPKSEPKAKPARKAKPAKAVAPAKVAAPKAEGKKLEKPAPAAEKKE